MSIKVLVVEDEKDSREFFATYLKMEGFKVATANDGLQGIEELMTERPDIIVSDISMPNLDGIEMVKLLRQSSEHQALLGILLSAMDSEYLLQG